MELKPYAMRPKKDAQPWVREYMATYPQTREQRAKAAAHNRLGIERMRVGEIDPSLTRSAKTRVSDGITFWALRSRADKAEETRAAEAAYENFTKDLAAYEDPKGVPPRKKGPKGEEIGPWLEPVE